MAHIPSRFGLLSVIPRPLYNGLPGVVIAGPAGRMSLACAVQSVRQQAHYYFAWASLYWTLMAYNNCYSVWVVIWNTYYLYVYIYSL